MRIRNLNIEEFTSSNDTPLEVIKISAPSDSVIYCNLVCCGRNLNNSDRLIVELKAAYSYTGGTLSEIIAPTSITSLKQSTLSTVVVDLEVSGSDISAIFTGVNGEDIEVTYWLTYYID